jgi:AraC family transcriptional regulator, activator of mtrCDE
MKMDVLNNILDTLNLRGALYFHTDFSGTWGVKVPDLPGAARFHLLVRGHCYISIAGDEPIALREGDLVLVPRGKSHVLADLPSREAPNLETVMQQCGYDGHGLLSIGNGDKRASTQMICGHLSFREGADHPILRALPDHVLATHTTRTEQPWLDDALNLIVRRVFSQDPGSAAAVTRLSEIVFAELLRLGIAQSPALSAMLEGFQDKQIGQALHLIHTRPSETWTVDSLAREVAMSRSRFAERFRESTHMSPMAYLSEWRLQKALALLDNADHSVQQVAEASGYQSPAAFTRAFTGKFGIAPSQYRRRTG